MWVIIWSSGYVWKVFSPLYFANPRKATHLSTLKFINRESKPDSALKDSIQREFRSRVLDLLGEWGGIGKQVTTYFESLMKVTDILPRKCHVFEYHNKVYNVPIYRISRIPKSLLIKCLAHLGDFPMTQQKGICPQCRRCRRHGFNLWVKKIPWSR